MSTEAEVKVAPGARIRSLDILRGIAILLVIGNHVDPTVIDGAPVLKGGAGFVYWRIKQLGWSGVDLFFVLSGFLIGGLLLTELERRGTIDCVRFWIRRGFKIWPSYFALLLVLAGFGVTHFVDVTSWVTMVKSWGIHGLFFQNYLARNPNGPTWSLAVEEHFYLLLPLLLLGLNWLAARRGRTSLALLPVGVLAVAIVCFAFRVANVLLGYVDPNDFMQSHFRLDSLMLGVYCQYVWMKRTVILQWLSTHRSLALVLVALLVSPSFFLSRSNPVMFTVGFIGLGVGYAMLLLVVREGFPARWEASKLGWALSWIGAWSYNIYLWHFFIPRMNLLWFADVNAALVRHVHSDIPLLALQGALYALYAVVVGAIATQIFERPFLALRSWVYRKPGA